GFSFHDDYEAFHDILIDYQWDMCQIQLNILDVEHQAGLKGLRLAGSLGIPVVIMEGLLGGSLVNAPEQVQALYDAFPIKRSSVEWAFRWLCNMEEVACVLSGVSSIEQTMDNLRIFDTVEVGCMSEEELALIDKVRQAYEARRKIGCTGCAYCMPCPGGVDIPGVFKLWNERFKLNRPLAGNQPYADMKTEGKTVDHCLDCGACEEVCPQHLPIREKLRCANEDMDG
ncbi:MAG: 4Fe-4S dicluster domain-containing protein, partial [Christensenellaceae bacterium]|nr:4Fe-4S dicluster domain-containing protein [Christensenellaceae bacterium]